MLPDELGGETKGEKETPGKSWKRSDSLRRRRSSCTDSGRRYQKTQKEKSPRLIAGFVAKMETPDSLVLAY
jgi:hypothetical protein